MGRSIWRLKYISKCNIAKIIKESTGFFFKKKTSVIFNKSSTIPESLVKCIFYLHKGNRLRKFKIGFRHIGYKFGEFTLTRKMHIFRKFVKAKKARR